MRSKILLALFLCSLMTGCATTGFGRFKGRALQLDVAIYQGMPPAEYPYRSLGPVEGFYPTNLFDMKITVAKLFAALEAMANHAKAMGANAVINTRLAQSNFKGFRYAGEAVVFEKLPPDQ